MGFEPKDYCIVSSKRDSAGMNISKYLEGKNENVILKDADIISINELPEADFYVFVSRHKSESEKPCLTCHFPGNFSDDAKMGGNPRELAFSFPGIEKIFIKNISELKVNNKNPELEKFQIVIEATHHGPTSFKKPVLFVEIGSSEKEWENKFAGKLIADAVIKTLSDIKKKNNFIPSIAFGGTHYSEKFTKVLLETKYSIGHVMPKYNLKNLNGDMFKQMIEKSVEKPGVCLIDWRGCSRKEEIVKLAEKYGLEVVRA